MRSHLSSLGRTLHLFHQLQGCPQGLDLHLSFQVHLHRALPRQPLGPNWWS